MHEQPRQAALVVISSAYTLGALILRSRARASNPHLSAEREHDTDSASWEISLGTDSRHEIIYPQQDDETRQGAVARWDGNKVKPTPRTERDPSAAIHFILGKIRR